MITSASRSFTNQLWPPLPIGLLRETRAYADMTSRLTKEKKKGREATGDFLGNGCRRKMRKHPDKWDHDELVHVCFGAVAQGDQLGVEFATEGHRNMLKKEGLLDYERELVSSHIWPGRSSLHGLVIDDFFVVDIIKTKEEQKLRRPLLVPRGWRWLQAFEAR